MLPFPVALYTSFPVTSDTDWKEVYVRVAIHFNSIHIHNAQAVLNCAQDQYPFPSGKLIFGVDRGMVGVAPGSGDCSGSKLPTVV